MVSAPQAVPEQCAPLRLQATPALFTSLVIAAVRARLVPEPNVVLAGGTIVTEIGADAETDSDCEALSPGTAMEVPVMETVSAVNVMGAV